MTGAVQDFTWLGTHQFAIKSTNGKLDTSPTARGNSGLFSSVISDVLTITIVNPCLRSIVNADGGLAVENLFVPINESLLDVTYDGPTDSISVIYGNGYDKCGNLKYEWLDPSGVPFKNSQFFG